MFHEEEKGQITAKFAFLLRSQAVFGKDKLLTEQGLQTTQKFGLESQAAREEEN